MISTVFFEFDVEAVVVPVVSVAVVVVVSCCAPWLSSLNALPLEPSGVTGVVPVVLVVPVGVIFVVVVARTTGVAGLSSASASTAIAHRQRALVRPSPRDVFSAPALMRRAYRPRSASQPRARRAGGGLRARAAPGPARRPGKP